MPRYNFVNNVCKCINSVVKHLLEVKCNSSKHNTFHIFVLSKRRSYEAEHSNKCQFFNIYNEVACIKIEEVQVPVRSE